MTDERDDSLTGTEGQEHQDGNAAETQTAGTGDEGAQGGNGGTAELEQLRQEKAELERQKGQWLAEKSNADAIKAENEQLRQQRQVVDPDRAEFLKAQKVYTDLAAARDAGDPYAHAILDQARLAMEIRHERMVERQIAAVPEAMREQVKSLYEGGGYRDPNAVWEAMKPAYEAQQQGAATKARANSEAADQVRQRVDTSTRTLGPAETRQKIMTFAAYEALQDAASTDPSKVAAAEKAFKDKEAGLLTLRVG